MKKAKFLGKKLLAAALAGTMILGLCSCDEEEYEDDWAGDSTPEAMPSRKRGRNGQRSSQTSIENDISGCFDALGGCVGVIFALVLLYQLVKYLGS